MVLGQSVWASYKFTRLVLLVILFTVDTILLFISSRNQEQVYQVIQVFAQKCNAISVMIILLFLHSAA